MAVKVNLVKKDEEDKVLSAVLSHVREELKTLDFGTITISCNAETGKMDVTTERKKRFEKK